ncbi:MAG: hypothetical protein B6245_08355, partial [Desulfobacteraceae bacterium 4572_88]
MLIPLISPLLIGVAAAAVSFRKITPRSLPLKALVFVLPLLLMRFFVPYPYSLGALFILAGLIIGFAANKIRPLTAVSAGFLFTGLILLIQSVCIPIFYVLTSRYHEVRLLNQLVCPFVRMFGLDVSMSEGIIYIPTFENLMAFPGTLEKTGLYLLFLMISGGGILFALFQRNWKKFAAFAGICLSYAFVRYVLMIFVYAQAADAAVYWNPLAFTLSYLPLAILLAAVLPVGLPEKTLAFDLPVPGFSAKNMRLTALFFIGIFLFVGTWGFDDPGERKQGRVLMDEKHSNWEWSTREFDTNWFGSQSTYNYYCMAEYLNYFYQVDKNVEHKLSRELLSKYDVLILKTPTMAYEAEEIENVVEFVRNGGGLWLIGDHTNVFGMNYYINFVAKRFGMFFHYDSTYDLDSGRLTFYKSPRIFPHPVVQNMPFFLFATSCTVDAPLLADNVMLGYGLRSRLLSYSDRSFFERKPTSDYEFGLFLQSAGTRYGKGRVLSYTDSTCFSNFYMFIPGKPELAMGSIEWLNRRNRYYFLPFVFGFLAITAIAAGLHQGRDEKKKALLILLFSALCAVPLSILCFTQLSEKSYAFPEPRTDYKQVCFETEHSKITLPTKALVDKHPDNYHTFYVWTQRMEYVPSVENSLSDALEKGDMVVMINPTKAFAVADTDQILAFVENGGRFLLLDGPQNKDSASDKLLDTFQMEIDFSEIKKAALFDRENKFMGFAKRSGSIRGGQSFLTTQDGKSVFSVKRQGKGLFGVMADSHIFANSQMGGT